MNDAEELINQLTIMLKKSITDGTSSYLNNTEYYKDGVNVFKVIAFDIATYIAIDILQNELAKHIYASCMSAKEEIWKLPAGFVRTNTQDLLSTIVGDVKNQSIIGMQFALEKILGTTFEEVKGGEKCR